MFLLSIVTSWSIWVHYLPIFMLLNIKQRSYDWKHKMVASNTLGICSYLTSVLWNRNIMWVTYIILSFLVATLFQGGNQFWLHAGHCFFDLLLLLKSYSKACLENPACLLDYKLMCFCLALGEIVCPCLPVNRRHEHTPSEAWTFLWRSFARLKTLSLFCPTATPSLFCLLFLVPHCFLLSDI